MPAESCLCSIRSDGRLQGDDAATQANSKTAKEKDARSHKETLILQCQCELSYN